MTRGDAASAALVSRCLRIADRSERLLGHQQEADRLTLFRLRAK